MVQVIKPVTLMVGPMYSGKTTALLDKVKEYQRRRYTVLLIKKQSDDRYSVDCVKTHAGESM